MSDFKADDRFEGILDAIADDPSLVGTLPAALRLQLSNYSYRKANHERLKGNDYMNDAIRRAAGRPKPRAQSADRVQGDADITSIDADMNAAIRRAAGRQG